MDYDLDPNKEAAKNINDPEYWEDPEFGKIKVRKGAAKQFMEKLAKTGETSIIPGLQDSRTMPNLHDDLPGGSTPVQYSLPVGATELQDLIEYRDMNFAIGNIFKAAFRLGHCDHSDPARDLRKIIFFAWREMERITKQPEGEV